MKEMQQRVLYPCRGKPDAISLISSPFTRNTPMTSKATVRIMTCWTSCQFESPLTCRLSKEKGMDNPTIKRKAGKMVSASPIPSTPCSTCSSQEGMLVSDHKSLTKIIRTMVMARRMSIEEQLWGMNDVEFLCWSAHD